MTFPDSKAEAHVIMMFPKAKAGAHVMSVPCAKEGALVMMFLSTADAKEHF